MTAVEENIYRLIPHEQRKANKEDRYVSKFKSSNFDDDKIKIQKYEHRTMGEPHFERDPQLYLKKHTREENDCKKSKDVKDIYSIKPADSSAETSKPKKPYVPKQDERPVMGLKTTKNFITQNAVESIMSVAKKPSKLHVDTRKGDKFPLDPSGWEPVFVNKKDYGQVPDYLIKRQDDIRRAQNEYDAYLAEMQRRGEMYQISPEERQHLLDGLKKNWEEFYHQYQSLPMVVDTAPKKNRKEYLESEMKKLERDIETIEKHNFIFVAN